MRVLKQVSKTVWVGNDHTAIWRKNLQGEYGFTIIEKGDWSSHMPLAIDVVAFCLGYTHFEPLSVTTREFERD